MRGRVYNSDADSVAVGRENSGFLSSREPPKHVEQARRYDS
jgi:hypothetical protein